MNSLAGRSLRAAILAILVLSASGNFALAQLRIVSYNTANGSRTGNNQMPRTGMDLVLAAIGNEVTNGFATPIDALLLQEQASPSTSTQGFVDVLNGIYGAGTYARSNVVSGPPFSDLRQTLVYNTQTLSLIGEVAYGETGSTKAARQTTRFHMRPVGYDSSADLYLYNNHYKSDTGTLENQRRNFEAETVRFDPVFGSDALGQGAHVIYAGDYNIQSSNQDMYQTLLSAGNGQAFDPLDAPGSWNNNSSFAYLHTQSPHDGSDGLTAFGMDDRFDFQLVTEELLDNEGLSIIDGSYRAFGNNGTTYNQAINVASNTYPLSQAELDALAHVSDHLPVVADYQLPAILSAQLATVPNNVPLGATVNFDVMVENAANVVTPIGADELDYSITVSGDLLGSASGTEFALGGFNSHSLMLDTSVAGMRSGVVTVSTTSQSAANPLLTFPVNFTVGGGTIDPMFGVIASDDFDSTMNRTAFSQTPTAGTFSSPADGFQPFQVGVSSTIPFALVDDSFSVFTGDQSGIVDASSDSPGYKDDTWFGVVDVNNPDNPSGEAAATWEFNIAGAVGLEVSIDMAAMGDFDAADTYMWTYSIDGDAAQALFSSSIDEAGSATYTLADGDMFTLDDPLLMTDAQDQTVQLSNEFQTLTSLLSGFGDTLTLMLTAITEGNAAGVFNDEAYAFDNIVIEGFTNTDADFDQDGDVDGDDFLTWQRNFGMGSTLAEGDANADGQVDQIDLDAWRMQFGTVSAGSQQLATAVPEPSSLLLAMGVLLFTRIDRNSPR